MPALITEILSTVDNVELVRDQIAAILKLELANQATLTGEPQPRIFLERSRPWGEFREGEPCARPIVNVWFDNSSTDASASNIVERQKIDATFNVDVYGYGVSTDDGNTVGGHVPADLAAALQAQATARLVRQILMSGHYTYLAMRGVVWRRWVQSQSMFQPQIDNRQAFVIVGSRTAFQVQLNEFSPQAAAIAVERISAEVKRAENGEVYLTADYLPTP